MLPCETHVARGAHFGTGEHFSGVKLQICRSGSVGRVQHSKAAFDQTGAELEVPLRELVAFVDPADGPEVLGLDRCVAARETIRRSRELTALQLLLECALERLEASREWRASDDRGEDSAGDRHAPARISVRPYMRGDEIGHRIHVVIEKDEERPCRGAGGGVESARRSGSRRNQGANIGKLA